MHAAPVQGVQAETVENRDSDIEHPLVTLGIRMVKGVDIIFELNPSSLPK